MKIINKKIVITILVILELCTIYVIYKSNNKKEIIYNQEIKEEKREKLAIMIQDESGKYNKYSNATFPSTGYKLNTTKSECLDIEGKKITNAISSSNGSITLKSKYTSYCTLYFDIDSYFEDLSGNSEGIFINKDNVTITDEGVSINTSNITTNISRKDLSNAFSIVVRFKLNGIDTSNSITKYHGIFTSGTCYAGSIQLNCHNLTIMYSNNIISPYTSFGYGEGYSNCFGNNIENNKFYTITIIYDNKTIKFYKNGKLEKTVTMTKDSIIPTDNYHLEALNTFSDFLVYDRVLTNEEISENFGETINLNNLNKQDLLLFYKFD